MQYALTMLAYLVPTFALGFVWHLVLFARYYETLEIYRRDIIVPFGFLSMLIQAAIFAWLYQTVFARRGQTTLARTAAYGVVGAILSWSFTTLAVAAKNVMSSVPDYLLIETAFTCVQWMLVAAATALVAAPWRRRHTATS
jgi:hypothetical protein